MQEITIDGCTNVEILPMLFGLPNLYKLRIHDSGLNYPPQITGVPGLLGLMLTSNNIHSFPEEYFNGLYRLRTVDFSNNKIVSMPDFSYIRKTLQYLEVQNNELTTSTFSNKPAAQQHTTLQQQQQVQQQHPPQSQLRQMNMPVSTKHCY